MIRHQLFEIYKLIELMKYLERIKLYADNIPKNRIKIIESIFLFLFGINEFEP